MSITRVSWTSRSVPAIARSSAVRADNLIVLSGITAAAGDGDVVAIGDPYTQMKVCLACAVAELTELGARVSDVVQTRIYLTDADQLPAVARAHREVFEHARPATTVVVAGLLDPRLLVEVEVCAYVERGDQQ